MSHVTKRVGRGQEWGTVGLDRGASLQAWVSIEKRDLVKSKAKSRGMTVSKYINRLVAEDIGAGYDAS